MAGHGHKCNFGPWKTENGKEFRRCKDSNCRLYQVRGKPEGQRFRFGKHPITKFECFIKVK